MSWSTALNLKNSDNLDTTSKQNTVYKVKCSIKHWKIFLDGIQIYLRYRNISFL
jgi:hypothetical protein